MKIIFIGLILILSCLFAVAQKDTIIKYYDTSYNSVTKENAYVYTYYVNDDSVYRCWSFYSKNNKLAAKFSTLDTTLFSRLFRYVSYHENGNTKDSMFFYDEDKPRYKHSFYKSGAKYRIAKYEINSTIFKEFVYYESGKLKAVLERTTSMGESICISYNENGEIMPDYIFEQEAEFKGGRYGWMRYLERNLNSDLPSKNGAPPGRYMTKVEFTIEKDGTVTNVNALNDAGYGTKQEAERVLRNSPKWKPAIQENKLVKYKAKQPITFVVQ